MEAQRFVTLMDTCVYAGNNNIYIISSLKLTIDRMKEETNPENETKYANPIFPCAFFTL